MTPRDRLLRITSDDALRAGLIDLAGTGALDYRDDILRRVTGTRQRPARTFIERWLPMSLLTARPATAPSARMPWALLLAGLLTAALATSLVIAGSLLTRQDGPTGMNSLIPILVVDDTWAVTPTSALEAPGGIDVGPDGDLYVASGGTDEIVVLDPAGREVRRWGEAGNGDGQFIFQRDPSDPADVIGGVAVGPDGSVYVADQGNSRVQLTPDGTFVQAWGGYGGQDGRFLEPIDITVSDDGTVYVVDDLRDDIQRFTPDGEWLQTIGRHGVGEGELNFTGGIDFSADGRLLNADFGNARIQAWDPDGAPVWSRTDGFVNPGDVAADDEGRLFVADDQGIKLLADGAAPATVETPPGWSYGWLAVADDGTVFASSTAGGRIYRLAVDLQEAGPESTTSTPDEPVVSPQAGAEAPSAAPSDDGGPETWTTPPGTFMVPFTAELPSTVPDSGSPGWQVSDIGPGSVTFQYVRETEPETRWPAYVVATVIAGVYSDPCHPEAGLATTADPSADELVQALTHMAGYRAGPISDIAFGDAHGKTFQLSNSIDATTCSGDPWLRPWTYRSSADSDAVVDGEDLPDTHQTVAIVDVDGVPILLEAWDLQAMRDEVLETESLFESIRFE